jgi:hypothetical protein
MSENRLSGLVVARFCDDFDLTGSEGWRLFKSAGVEMRRVMLDHYSASERGRDIDRWMADPDALAIDEFSTKLDAQRAVGTGAFERDENGARRTRGNRSATERRSHGLGEDPQLPPAKFSDTDCPVCASAGWSICNCT